MQENYNGSIVLMKNIIFCDSTIGKNLDHAYKTGRPCLLLFSDDTYDYFLTIKSSLSSYDKENDFYQIKKHDLDYISTKDNKPIKGFINVKYIYKRPICSVVDTELGRVTPECYEKVMKVFEQTHPDDFNDLLTDASNIHRLGR